MQTHSNLTSRRRPPANYLNAFQSLFSGAGSTSDSTSPHNSLIREELHIFLDDMGVRQ